MKQDEGLFDSKLYADLGSAWHRVASAEGAKDTTVEAAKLTGKFAWNVVVFAGKFGLQCVEKLPEVIEKQKNQSR